MHRCRPPVGRVGPEAAGRGLHLDRVAGPHLVHQPVARTCPSGDLAHADPRPRPDGRADRVGAAVLARRRRRGAASATARRRSRRRRAGRRARRRSPRPRRRTAARRRPRSASWKPARSTGAAPRVDGSETVIRSPSRARTARGTPCSGTAPCTRSARTPRSARRRAEPQRGQVNDASGRQSAGSDRPAVRGAGPGGGDAVLGQRAPAALGDPVARPGGREADPHLDVAEPGVGEPMHAGRRASWPSPGSRSTSA